MLKKEKIEIGSWYYNETKIEKQKFQLLFRRFSSKSVQILYYWKKQLKFELYISKDMVHPAIKVCNVLFRMQIGKTRIPKFLK